MATSSLTNFTVPLSTNQSASAQGLLMPKLAWRFRVTFDNFGVTQPTTELTKQIIDCSRPNASFEEIVLDIYNSKAYLAGKPKWEELSLSLRDDATGEVSKRVGEQLQKQFDFMEQSSAASGIDYKFTTRIEMLDGGAGSNTPIPLETWEVYGCFLKSVDYGKLEYKSNEVVKIDIKIRFDNALQSPAGTGVGSVVARTLGSIVTG